MASEVTLPRDIAIIIENFREQGFKNNNILHSIHTVGSVDDVNVRALKVFAYVQNNYDELLSALVNGYTIEQTPEEKVREYYEDRRLSHAGSIADYQADAVKETLNLLGIKIEGINA